MPNATKCGRMVTELKPLRYIKLLDYIITWSCKITWLTKNISTLTQCLWPKNLTGWRLLPILSHDNMIT